MGLQLLGGHVQPGAAAAAAGGEACAGSSLCSGGTTHAWCATISIIHVLTTCAMGIEQVAACILLSLRGPDAKPAKTTAALSKLILVLLFMLYS